MFAHSRRHGGRARRTFFSLREMMELSSFVASSMIRRLGARFFTGPSGAAAALEAGLLLGE
jgi:hypothetical protein